MSSAHRENDRKVSNDCGTARPRTTGGLPRPPPIRPSARSAASACLTGPRDTPHSSHSCDSEGRAAPWGSSAEAILRRRSAAIWMCSGRSTNLTIQVTCLDPTMKDSETADDQQMTSERHQLTEIASNISVLVMTSLGAADLVVVGAGIVGLAHAVDAAARGLS